MIFQVNIKLRVLIEEQKKQQSGVVKMGVCPQLSTEGNKLPITKNLTGPLLQNTLPKITQHWKEM